METPTLNELIPTLQLAIAPVILISGVGLLLLTLTNRFGRLLDRARLLNRDHPDSPQVAADVRAQIDILHRRSAILRLSIILGAITVLLVPVLILVLFLSALLKLEASWLVIVLFCAGQVTLVGSMLAFIRDMNLALAAVRLEIGSAS